MKKKSLQFSAGIIIGFIILISLIIFSTCVALKYKEIFNGGFSVDHSQWGEFGSFIGGISTAIGTIIATFGSIFVLMTLINHQKQLDLQRAHQEENLTMQKLVFCLEKLKEIKSDIYENHKKHSKNYQSPNELIEKTLSNLIQLIEEQKANEPIGSWIQDIFYTQNENQSYIEAGSLILYLCDMIIHTNMETRLKHDFVNMLKKSLSKSDIFISTLYATHLVSTADDTDSYARKISKSFFKCNIAPRLDFKENGVIDSVIKREVSSIKLETSSPTNKIKKGIRKPK